jgi:hypothetical protein
MKESTGRDAKIGCAWKKQEAQLRELVASRTNLKVIGKALGRNITGITSHCKKLGIDLSNLRDEEEEEEADPLATDNQLAYLENNKIPFDRATLTKKIASNLIGDFIKRDRQKKLGGDSRLATLNQLDALRKNGVEMEPSPGLTFDEASARLDVLSKNRPPTEKQVRALGAIGYKSYHIRDMSFKDASALIQKAQLRRY